MDRPSQMQTPPPATTTLSNTTNSTNAHNCGGPNLGNYLPIKSLKPLNPSPTSMQ